MLGTELENHGRQVSRSDLQNLSEVVGQIVQQTEETWHDCIPKLPAAVSTVSIGVDGTCLLLCQEGYREAMVGTILGKNFAQGAPAQGA